MQHHLLVRGLLSANFLFISHRGCICYIAYYAIVRTHSNQIMWEMKVFYPCDSILFACACYMALSGQLCLGIL